MSLWDRILHDIRHGENIDLYLTVLASLGIAVLNIFGFAPSNLIESITLAVLGLLAFSALRNRHEFEETVEKLVNSQKHSLLEEVPPTFKSDIEASRSLIMVGASLGNTITVYQPLLERKAQKGDIIKVLLVHPEGAAPEMAASRALLDPGGTKLKFRINTSIETMCHIKSLAPNNTEIRTIQNPLSYSAFLINYDSSASQGILYLENYPYKSPVPYVPKQVFHEHDGQWYEFFKSEVLRLWENGTDWPCS